nr:immunoglobulin heavy chain junction region [Macaca mulatta]MOV39221.1 immunoglobulin heavy chain junction region [Macaca mulatta]MOV39526.1 immunoglobulin heavy chain junction region [Macaca mulatta]MOV40960.1 immunoglobulin heavy chain junction region [Macaca mulatta]MOV43851.1 immunoglobulin heavy chain junction region [Macaca mulatta]
CTRDYITIFGRRFDVW